MSRLLLLVILLSVTQIRAETQSSPTPVPLPSVPEAAPGTIRIRLFLPPIRGILAEDTSLTAFPAQVWLQTEDGPELMQLRRNGYTRSVTLSTPGQVELFRVTADGTKGKLYASAALPKDVDAGVALLAPDETDSEGRIPFQVYPLASIHSPAGWHSFLNHLEREVEIRLKDQTHHVPAGEQIALKLGEGRQRIFILESGGKHSRRYTGAIYPREQRGVLHVIKPRPDSTRRLEVVTLIGPLAPVSEENSP